jgi:hypothetical protein
MDLVIGFYLAVLIVLSLLSSWLQELGFLFLCKISKEKIPNFRSLFLIQAVSFLIISQINVWGGLYKVYGLFFNLDLLEINKLSSLINNLTISSIQILIVALLTSYFMKIRPSDSIKSQIFIFLIDCIIIFFLFF